MLQFCIHVHYYPIYSEWIMFFHLLPLHRKKMCAGTKSDFKRADTRVTIQILMASANLFHIS